jgi:hypothetical protein
MSPQACVIFMKVPPSDLRGGFNLNVPGAMLMDFESLAAREEYCCSGPHVWWYAFVEDMDSVFDRSGGAVGQPRQQNVGVVPRPWKKGGAWEAEEFERDLERKQEMKEDRGDVW